MIARRADRVAAGLLFVARDCAVREFSDQNRDDRKCEAPSDADQIFGRLVVVRRSFFLQIVVRQMSVYLSVDLLVLEQQAVPNLHEAGDQDDVLPAVALFDQPPGSYFRVSVRIADLSWELAYESYPGDTRTHLDVAALLRLAFRHVLQSVSVPESPKAAVLDVAPDRDLSIATGRNRYAPG